jgi:acetyl esterase/lipase
MPYSYDRQFASVLQALRELAGEVPQLQPGDWKSLRKIIEVQMGALAAATPAAPDIDVASHQMTAADGGSIGLRWYTKAGAKPGAAVLYIHGGGMISGNLDLYHAVVCEYVQATGVPMLGVEYRLAPEHPHPTPVEDCFAALSWLAGTAPDLSVDPQRIAVMGDSAGGGLAAAVALLARDRGLPLARQILIYPMLDDRNTVPDAALAPFVGWTYENNLTGWCALLGAARGGAHVPPTAAPARATDLRNLAPAYMEVGELDIFRDEDIEYARRLAASGVSVELHVHAGVPHGFERLAPTVDVARRALADRWRVISAL